MTGIADDIKKQQEIVKQSRLKIEKLKEKAAKRMVRIADKAGFFEVDISDEALAQAFAGLVKTARAPSDNQEKSTSKKTGMFSKT